jgi:excisionase family DNA binding protein
MAASNERLDKRYAKSTAEKEAGNSVLAQDNKREQVTPRLDGGRQPAYLTVEEVANEYLRTSKKAVYAMIKRRQLPGVVRFLRRRVLVRRVDIVRWLGTSQDSVEE